MHVFFTSSGCTRSDASLLLQQPLNPNHLPSSASSSSSPPSTPHRPSSYTGVCLTPVSSRGSLAPLRSHKDSPRRPLTPATSPRRSDSRHRPFLPPQPFFALPTQYISKDMAASSSSRASSPSRRSRALSVTRPELTRPPSRCESLLRDTLRKDEDRVNCHRRSGSQSPRRWANTRAATTRPRGNSYLAALKAEEGEDTGECGIEDCLFARGGCHFHRAMASAPRAVSGTTHARRNTGDDVSSIYGSPSSPSPMPPAMQRTRTAPAVPRTAKSYACDEEHAAASRPPPVERRSLPNTVPQSYIHSGDSSPKVAQCPQSPQGAVLKAKLESVLARAVPTLVEDIRPGRARNHQRAFSHGVIVNTTPRQQDDPSSGSPSPHSLAASSTSNSATDLARMYSTPSYRRDSRAQRSSPTMPPEPLTPPPTPPFNARTASEVCKRMDGYVSFASVEGLGEPPGMDMNAEETEDGSRVWTKWFRKWTTVVVPVEHEAPIHPSRGRSDSVES